MPPRLIIFDMDEVLYDYEHAKRLAYLERLTGRPAAALHAAIWASGFEDHAEAGAYATGDEYLAAYGEHLAYPISRAEWIAARRAMMRPRPAMLALARALGAQAMTAMLSNNGMLLKEELAAIAPEAAAIFAERAFVSAEFGTKKPDPEIFRKLVSRLGVAPAEALFIDDKAHHVAGARKAGLLAHHFLDIDTLRKALTAQGIAC